MRHDCSYKLRFPTRRAAERYIKEGRCRQPDFKAVRAYPCSCGCWHVTSRERSDWADLSTPERILRITEPDESPRGDRA